MKRYVARSTGGDGMTHWYEYWDGTEWVADISRAKFYETTCPYLRNAGGRLLTMIEVELTIKEKA